MRRRFVAAALSALVISAASTTPAIPAHGAAKFHARTQVRDAQWHLRYLKATEAHRVTQGAGITVAVPDTGVEPHPDLSSNLLSGTSTIAGSEGDGCQDNSGHGTLMAGLIAAHGQTARAGALGIAPKAKILPIRVKPTGGEGSTEDLAAGIEWAVAKGADVISISAVAGASVRLQRSVRAALDAEIIVVAAAGNRPDDVRVGYPASEPGVIAVGGTDASGQHARVSVTGSEIDVVAPAVEIYSTNHNGGYSKGTGTSSAAAIVAGAAALIRASYPYLPVEEVAHRLTATAVDKGPPGHDDEYGYGVIDLVAALTADVPPLGFESAPGSGPGGGGNATVTAAPPASAGNGDGAAARGLATLGVIVVAGGAYVLVRRRRRMNDPPPRISR